MKQYVLATLAFGCSGSVATPAEDAQLKEAFGAQYQQVMEIRQDCLQQFAAPRFALLRDKVPFLVIATDQMRDLRAKPSPAERTALRELQPLATDCQKRVLQIVNPGQPTDMYLYSLAQNSELGSLALLASGQITYSDYVAIRDASTKEGQAKADQAMRDANQLAAQEAVITLSCVVREQPQNALGPSLSGMEFQYTIDTAHNAASASRGAGPPINVRVTPTLIAFNQGEFFVTISRATGRFTQSIAGNPYQVSGICEPRHQVLNNTLRKWSRSG